MFRTILGSKRGDDIAGAMPATFADTYLVECAIEAGHTGVVWRGEETGTRERVALKFFSPDLVRDPAVLAKMRQTIDGLQHCTAPGVVAPRQLAVGGRFAAVVTPWVDGPTLRQVQQNKQAGYFDVDETRGWLAAFLAALEDVHTRGFVHGALHPGLIFPKADRVAVVGWEVNAWLERATRSRDAARAKAPYASPSLRRGEPPCVSDDIYAVGVILYEVLTGRLPGARWLSRGPESMGRERRRQGGRTTDIPAMWDRTIRRCLEPVERDRLDSIRALRLRLELPVPAPLPVDAPRATKAPAPRPGAAPVAEASRREEADTPAPAPVASAPPPTAAQMAESPPSAPHIAPVPGAPAPAPKTPPPPVEMAPPAPKPASAPALGASAATAKAPVPPGTGVAAMGSPHAVTASTTAAVLERPSALTENDPAEPDPAIAPPGPLAPDFDALLHPEPAALSPSQSSDLATEPVRGVLTLRLILAVVTMLTAAAGGWLVWQIAERHGVSWTRLNSAIGREAPSQAPEYRQYSALDATDDRSVETEALEQPELPARATAGVTSPSVPAEELEPDPSDRSRGPEALGEADPVPRDESVVTPTVQPVPGRDAAKTAPAVQPSGARETSELVVVPAEVPLIRVPQRFVVRPADGPPLSGGIFDLQYLDVPPRIVDADAPAVPQPVLAAAAPGHVEVVVVVDRMGRVASAIAYSATDEGLVEPSLSAARQWRFSPGMRQGQPVAARVSVPLVFELAER